MRHLVAGMSPHMGVRKGTTGFARGAPFFKRLMGYEFQNYQNSFDHSDEFVSDFKFRCSNLRDE